MDSSKSRVGIKELKSVIDSLFAHIVDDLKITEVELDQNFYWEVAESQLFDLKNKPSSPTMGSLFEDWEFLLPILEDKELTARSPASAFDRHEGWPVSGAAAEDKVQQSGICEFLWAMRAGYRNVTASYGVEGFTDDHLAAFKAHGTKRVLPPSWPSA